MKTLTAPHIIVVTSRQVFHRHATIVSEIPSDVEDVQEWIMENAELNEQMQEAQSDGDYEFVDYEEEWAYDVVDIYGNTIIGGNL